MRRKRRTILLACAVAGLLLAVLLWPRPKALYRVTVLPSLGGQFTLPQAINDRGQVAGFSEVTPGDYHLFLWDRKKGMQDLGPVCNDRLDLNNAGQITGTARDPNGTQQAFLWDPTSGLRLLGSSGGAASRGLTINNPGQIAGSFETSAGVHHAFLWDPVRGMRDLGPGRAWAINDAGEVVVLGSSGRALVKGNDGITAPRLSVPLWGLLSINNGGWVTGVGPASKSSFDVILWHAGCRSRSLMQIGKAHSSLINDANQVLVTDEHPVQLPLLGQVRALTRVRCYLCDPARGRIRLDQYLPAGLRTYWWATDLNNEGCIIGAIQSTTSSDSQGILLEPILEHWRK